MRGRFKDEDWNLADDQGKIGTWERVTIAVLMDIRDELRQLNFTTRRANFLEIPFKLDAIVRNTRKRRPCKKKSN